MMRLALIADAFLPRRTSAAAQISDLAERCVAQL